MTEAAATVEMVKPVHIERIDQLPIEGVKPTPIDNSSLMIVMSSRDRAVFDFIGKFVGQDEQYLYLENPLVLNYNPETMTIESLEPMHLPMGMVDVLGGTNILYLPHVSVSYAVRLPLEANDWLHDEYYKFFSQAENI